MTLKCIGLAVWNRLRLCMILAFESSPNIQSFLLAIPRAPSIQSVGTLKEGQLATFICTSVGENKPPAKLQFLLNDVVMSEGTLVHDPSLDSKYCRVTVSGYEKPE